MATAREILQGQMDAISADLIANPIIYDPRLAEQATIAANLAEPADWLDIELDVIKAFIEKNL